MSMYVIFEKVMQENMLEPLFDDYQAALQIYKDQINHCETDYNFAQWLDNYIAHAQLDGF